MDLIRDTAQRAAEAMSQGSVPCASAEAMLPMTSQSIPEAGARALHHSGVQSGTILSAMLGVFIFAAAAAFLLFRKLEQKAARSRAQAGTAAFILDCRSLHTTALSTTLILLPA